MGLFGGNSPTLTLPQAPTLQTGTEARQTALDFGQANTPLALGARESALQDLSSPQATQEFFQGFQPTSFEQALADQSFANVAPDIERSINQQVSLRGLEGSVLAPRLIAEQRGNLGVSIGNILAQLGQQRGQGSLNARLGIDPISQIINPISTQDINQSNKQQEMQFQRDLAQAIASFQQEQQASAGNRGKAAGIGTLLGTGLGIAAAPFTGGLSLLGGAALGGALGGTAGSLFGGGSSPVGLGDALSVIQAFPGTSGASTPGINQGTAGTVQGVFGQSAAAPATPGFPGLPTSGVSQSIFDLIP